MKLKSKIKKQEKNESTVALLQKAARHHQAGQTTQAVNLYSRILKKEPKNADALNSLGIISSQSEDYAKAEQYFKRAIKILPNIPSFYTNLGHALKNHEKYDEAIECYQSAINLTQGNQAECAKGFLNIAKTYAKNNKDAEAVDFYNRSLEINPENPETLTRLGNSHKALGKFEEAIMHYQRAQSIRPDYVEAIHELASCKKFSDSDAEYIAIAEKLATKDDLPEDKKAFLFFALGKTHNDLKLYDKAFDYYQKGNTIRNNMFPFDSEAFAAKTNKIMDLFTTEFFAKKNGVGIPTEVPVFIVGMPRSGTTLVEQIISKHSQVFGAGELNKIGETAQVIAKKGKDFPENILNLKKNAIEKMAREYEQHLQQIKGPNIVQRITDKMPANFQYLGLIALLFPNAHIIHCSRTPMDTCLSNFFQCFSEGNTQSYDLKAIGEYYGEYDKLMKHWRQVLPLPIHEVVYEELIDDQEKNIRKLIEFIGLEWEEGCLRYQTNKKVVNTASVWQARQPIYKTSKERWRKYECFLDPLKKGLESKGIVVGS